MKKQFFSLLLGSLVLIATTGPAYGWGQNGHRITAEIAQRNLNDHAKTVVTSILDDDSLAEIATWPDDIRSDGEWDFSQPWHFLSINDAEQWDNFERAPEEVGDVLSALENLEVFLADPTTETIVLQGVLDKIDKSAKKPITQKKRIGKREALAFYVHFVGDIHQPLHVGRREDFGGNKIGVTWFGDDINLHKVWDESLIASTDLSFTELATFLNPTPADEDAECTNTGYLCWAKESKAVREKVYDFGKQKNAYYLNVTNPPVLEWAYRHETLPIIKERLTKGGFRLATKLNEIFAEYP